MSFENGINQLKILLDYVEKFCKDLIMNDTVKNIIIHKKSTELEKDPEIFAIFGDKNYKSYFNTLNNLHIGSSGVTFIKRNTDDYYDQSECSVFFTWEELENLEEYLIKKNVEMKADREKAEKISYELNKKQFQDKIANMEKELAEKKADYEKIYGGK